MRSIIKLFGIYFLGHEQWNFQIGFSPRDRLMIYSVAYDDGRIGQIFVAHRLSFMDIVVPYGDPNAPHYGKNAFFMLGRMVWEKGIMHNSLNIFLNIQYTVAYLTSCGPHPSTFLWL